MSDISIKGHGDALRVLDGSESSSVDSFGLLTPSSLKRQLYEDYGRRAMELVSRYFRAIYDLSAYANKVTFLKRCRFMGVVPAEYRVKRPYIKNTRHVVRILDTCSFKLMLADLDYNRMRKVQVSRLLEVLHERLANFLSSEDLHKVLALSKAKYESVFEATREKQRVMFAELLEEYEIHRGKEKDDE